MVKCSDCGKQFEKKYPIASMGNIPILWAKCEQCDVFDWCWDCDEKKFLEEQNE